MNTYAKSVLQNISNQNSATHKNDYTRDQEGFIQGTEY